MHNGDNRGIKIFVLDKTPLHDDFIDVLLFRAFSISMVISLLIIHVKGYPKCYTVYLLIIYFALININIYYFRNSPIWKENILCKVSYYSELSFPLRFTKTLIDF